MQNLLGLIALFFVCACVHAGSGNVSQPGSTGHVKLDRFVGSSFGLYNQNEYVFYRVDEVGLLSAFIAADPQGFVKATASGSLSDAVDMAKASTNSKIRNWERTLSNNSLSKVVSGVSGDTKAGLLARSADIARTYDMKELGSSTKGVGTKAQGLLSDANKLLRDIPKNPLKVKRYLKSLNASKSVLKTMAVEYPDKIKLISRFLSE